MLYWCDLPPLIWRPWLKDGGVGSGSYECYEPWWLYFNFGISGLSPFLCLVGVLDAFLLPVLLVSDCIEYWAVLMLRCRYSWSLYVDMIVLWSDSLAVEFRGELSLCFYLILSRCASFSISIAWCFSTQQCLCKPLLLRSVSALTCDFLVTRFDEWPRDSDRFTVDLDCLAVSASSSLILSDCALLIWVKY